MKKFALILFIFTALISCKKENNEACFKVKFIDDTCQGNIYQILDERYQHLGEDNWLLQRDNVYFDNVFIRTNYCDPLPAVNSDSTILVKIDNRKIDYSCYICLAIYPNPPTKGLAIKKCSSN